ncbi:MAG: hypothetical protein ACK41D_10930 [Rubricoccaceae bacterium]
MRSSPMLRWLPLLVSFACHLVASPALAQPGRLSVELEAGPAWQSRNDVEIPNDGAATRFSLKELTGSGPAPAGRVYVTWQPGARHALRLLVAPLSVTATGVPDQPIRFAGEAFAAGAETESTYTFNSYRLTYRYALLDGERAGLWIGFTAKVRDALVGLEQPGVTARDTDLGFVPLLHLAPTWRFAPGWEVGLDVDALAGGPGRAIDGAVRVGYDLSDRLTVRAGYRTVEGGADVDAVYNFAWLHYAVGSVTVRL